MGIELSISFAFISSPFGYLKVSFDNSYIYYVKWVGKGNVFPSSGSVKPEHFELHYLIKKEFELFWNKKLFNFTIPLKIPEGTEFQKRVWLTLMKIPYGSTRTYSELAEMVGIPKAARAVGNACAKNPIALLIPCHRIIRSDGTIGNYSAPGGGFLKKKLIEFEKTAIPPAN